MCAYKSSAEVPEQAGPDTRVNTPHIRSTEMRPYDSECIPPRFVGRCIQSASSKCARRRGKAAEIFATLEPAYEMDQASNSRKTDQFHIEAQC